MRETDFAAANLRSVDVTTLVLNSPIRGGFPDETTGTDLGLTRGLSQGQINGMKGDHKTVLPQGLQRPKSWLGKVWRNESLQSQYLNRSEQFSARIRFHIQNARGAALTAEPVAYFLDAEARLLRQGSNQLGPEIDLMDDLVLLLRSFATEVADPDPSPATLEQQLSEALAKIEELTAKLEAAEAAAKAPSEIRKSFQQSAGKALGIAVVAAPLGAITGGLAYLLGPTAQATLSGFAEAAASGGIGALK